MEAGDPYATMSLPAGVSLFSLGPPDGASVEMIDRTHGHLAPEAEDYERALLDAYDSRDIAAKGEEARSRTTATSGGPSSPRPRRQSVAS